VRIHIAILTCFLLQASCTPASYTWQDQYNLNREDFSSDLEFCRRYSANQYQPGIPKGAPYLDQHASYPTGDSGLEPSSTSAQISGEWHSDRNPMRWINISRSSRHEVETGYTGYPGELDYARGYTDDILEKCMSDRGWAYLPEDPAQ